MFLRRYGLVRTLKSYILELDYVANSAMWLSNHTQSETMQSNKINSHEIYFVSTNSFVLDFILNISIQQKKNTILTWMKELYKKL